MMNCSNCVKQPIQIRHLNIWLDTLILYHVHDYSPYNAELKKDVLKITENIIHYNDGSINFSKSLFCSLSCSFEESVYSVCSITNHSIINVHRYSLGIE